MQLQLAGLCTGEEEEEEEEEARWGGVGEAGWGVGLVCTSPLLLSRRSGNDYSAHYSDPWLTWEQLYAAGLEQLLTWGASIRLLLA